MKQTVSPPHLEVATCMINEEEAFRTFLSALSDLGVVLAEGEMLSTASVHGFPSSELVKRFRRDGLGRVGIQSKKHGFGLLEYSITEEVQLARLLFGSGILGVPSEGWSKGDAQRARGKARSFVDLLKGVVQGGGVVYGGLGVETSLAVPSALRGARSSLPDGFYLGNLVIDTNPSLKQEIERLGERGLVREWPCGVFATSWEVFAGAVRLDALAAPARALIGSLVAKSL